MSVNGSFQFQPLEGDQHTVLSIRTHILSMQIKFQIRYLTLSVVHSKLQILPLCTLVVQRYLKRYFEKKNPTEETDMVFCKL